MKILHLTFNLPCPPMRGAQVRDLALISRTAQSHHVELVTLSETDVSPTHLAQMHKVCPEIDVLRKPIERLPKRLTRSAELALKGVPLAATDYYFPSVQDALRNRLAKGDVDIFQIEHSLLAPYVRAAEISPKTQTVLSLHNVGALQYRRMAQIETGLFGRTLGWAKARLMQKWEAEWCNKFDQVIVVSDPDAEVLRTMGVSRPITVIPNGIDLPPKALPLSHAEKLLFVGNLRYPPNRDAALWLTQKIIPLLQRDGSRVGLTVAGYDPPPAFVTTLERTGTTILASPADLVPLYSEASVVLAPLRAGGGTRIKILEALAMGKPVVATRMAAEGLGLEDGKSVLFAETEHDFAKRIHQLMNDPALRKALGVNGRAYVKRLFDWDIVAASLEQVYQSLTAKA